MMAMADLQHLEILKKGVHEWNQWRENNSQIKPNLSNLNLFGMNLPSHIFARQALNEIDFNLLSEKRFAIDVEQVDFSERELGGLYSDQKNTVTVKIGSIDLTGANLRETDFRRTNLSGSILTGADLTKADLFDSNLTYTDLTKANLRETVLVSTNLTGAVLSEAELYGAELHGTI